MISSSLQAMTSSSIALRLLRDEAVSMTGGIMLTNGPKVDMAADSAEYQDKLDRGWRLDAANTFKVALEHFHADYASAAKLGLALQTQAESLVEAKPQSLEGFSPEDAKRLSALGADAAILVPAIELDDATFNALVVPRVQAEYKDQPGFAEALATGQVKVQRTSAVPEFNFGHKSFALFKDGYMIGGAGWGQAFNQTLYDRIASTGIQQGFGGVMGQDYYVTWPTSTST